MSNLIDVLLRLVGLDLSKPAARTESRMSGRERATAGIALGALYAIAMLVAIFLGDVSIDGPHDDAVVWIAGGLAATLATAVGLAALVFWPRRRLS